MLRPPKKKEEEKDADDDEDDYDCPRLLRPHRRPRVRRKSKRKADLLKAAEDFDKKLLGIETSFVSPALLNSDDKYFVEPYKVYLNLMWLNAEVGTGGGDVAGGADFAPTDTQMELLQGFEAEISATDANYQKLMKEDFPP